MMKIWGKADKFEKYYNMTDSLMISNQFLVVIQPKMMSTFI